MKEKYLLITLIFLIQSCSKQNKLFVLLKSEKRILRKRLNN